MVAFERRSLEKVRRQLSATAAFGLGTREANFHRDDESAEFCCERFDLGPGRWAVAAVGGVVRNDVENDRQVAKHFA